MEKKIITRNFILGSAAPKLQPEAPDKRQREEELRRRRRERAAIANRSRFSSAGILYTLFAVAVVAVAFVLCINYIRLINQKNINEYKISAAEEQLSLLKEENDELLLSIETGIDMDEIYRVAIYELGMVHATSDNIINYNSNESEYVMQYSNIPD